MSGCTKIPFGWSCQISEDAPALAQMAVYAEERETEERDEHLAERLAGDMAERLAGDCERCQEPCDTGLTLDGGQAVCDGCTGSEAA